MISALKRVVKGVDPRTSWIGYLLCAIVLLSLGLTILDPSASRDLSFIARLIFWLGHVGAGVIILEAVHLALGRTVLSDWFQPWAQTVAAGFIGAIILSAVSFFALDPLFAHFGTRADDDGFNFGEFLSEIQFSAGVTFVFWLLLNSPRLVTIARQRELDHVPSSLVMELDQTPDAESADRLGLDYLLQKLPHRIGADVVALSAELHYLRVYTSKGNALILMPLGKAIKAVECIKGISIHRSHWIAIDHVVKVQTQDSRVLCHMSTGLILPVSRTGRSKLKHALDAQRIEKAIREAKRSPST